MRTTLTALLALVVEGDSWEQLKLGVGHHLNTANPGERGNMVLSAHNDIYGEIFRRLPSLELGNEIVVYAGEQPYRYVVKAKQIVEPTEVSVLATTTRPVTTAENPVMAPALMFTAEREKEPDIA